MTNLPPNDTPINPTPVDHGNEDTPERQLADRGNGDARAGNGETNLPDPFDPEAYRTPPEGEPGSGVVAQPTKLSVRRPKKTEFFRTHPELRLHTSVLEGEDGLNKTYYMVKPLVAALNIGEFKKVELRLCINRDGGMFLWPVPQPDENGRDNDWNVTKREAAVLAETRWVRLKSNMVDRQYMILVAPPGLPDPKWPQETMRNILERAFDKDRLIDSDDHPKMKELRGE
jgi:hypothetical protein